MVFEVEYLRKGLIMKDVVNANLQQCNTIALAIRTPIEFAFSFRLSKSGWSNTSYLFFL